MKALLRSAYRLALSMLSPRPAAPAPRRRLQLEELENRLVPSVASPNFHVTPMAAAATATYTPAQIRHAYGFDRTPYDGTGQTIAIVDAFDDPKILSDLQTFDRTFGLADPTFTKATPGGVPPSDPVWAGEISLDVEWAHAIAPRAKILLVEAASDSYTDLLNAVDYARNQAGVVAVSMSWGGDEFLNEHGLDWHFTAPTGHGGVVFVASSGDNGAGAQWPAVSPNVLAVGGTGLTLSAQNTWLSETAWSSSGGGQSQYEAEPSFQRSVQGSGKRTAPDVAYNADPNTGFYVYDSVPSSSGQTGWFSFGGTSAGAPQWAALIALADQGRGWNHVAPLSSAGAAVYSLAAADFHDISSGGNGLSAVSGYDQVTGRGSPRADLVVADLVKYVEAAPNKTTTTPTKPPATTTKANAASPSTAGQPPTILEIRGERVEQAISALLRNLHAHRQSEKDFDDWGLN